MTVSMCEITELVCRGRATFDLDQQCKSSPSSFFPKGQSLSCPWRGSGCSLLMTNFSLVLTSLPTHRNPSLQHPPLILLEFIKSQVAKTTSLHQESHWNLVLFSHLSPQSGSQPKTTSALCWAHPTLVLDFQVCLQAEETKYSHPGGFVVASKFMGASCIVECEEGSVPTGLK